MSTVLTPLSELLLNTPLIEVSLPAEPDETPVLVHVAPGGSVTWSITSTRFTEFKIVFTGPSPVAKGHKLTGKINRPVKINLSNKRGTYAYTIVYKPDDLGIPPGSFAVRSCKVCGA